MPRLCKILCAVTLLLYWAGVAVLLSADGLFARVIGWVLLGGKLLMLLATVLGALRSPQLAWHLFCGRYLFDGCKYHGISQSLTRFTWELPQTLLGYLYSQMRILMGDVVRVESYCGINYAVGLRKNYAMGMSLGCCINLWVPQVKGDFENYVRSHEICRHEYGHTFDSQLFGWLYLFVIGIPSLVSVLLSMHGFTTHDHCYTERRADRFAEKYFKTE